MLRLVLLRIFESYFRHRWLYLLPIVLMGAASAVYASSMAPTYSVSGTLYVQNGTLLSSLTDIRSDGFAYVTPAQATSGELYQLLNSYAFLRAIIQQTDMESKMGQGEAIANETIDEAKQAISLQELGNNLIMITARHEMPRIAHQLAASTIETYIQWKINLNREESVAAQTFFTDLIKTYSAEVEPARLALDSYLKTRPRPIQGDRPEEEAEEIKRLQAALSTAEERLSRAENQEESARLALTQAESTVRQTYFVVDAPTRPLTAERSKKELAMAIALFLFAGAFISATGVIGGALLDSSLRFPIDVVHGLNLPVLTSVPDAKIQVAHPVHRTRELADRRQQFTPRVAERAQHNGGSHNGGSHRRVEMGATANEMDVAGTIDSRTINNGTPNSGIMATSGVNNGGYNHGWIDTTPIQASSLEQRMPEPGRVVAKPVAPTATTTEAGGRKRKSIFG